MNISSKFHYIKNSLKCSTTKLKLQQKEICYLILFIQLSILFTNIYSTDTTKQLNVQDIVKTFHIAINENNIKEVKRLLIRYNSTDIDLANSQDDKKTPALWRAAHNSYIDLVKLLTKFGANKNTKHPNNLSTPFFVAVIQLSRQKGNIDNLIKIIKYFNKHNFDIKSPMYSIKNNLFSYPHPVLTMASLHRKPDLYVYLIKRGVSLDNINFPDNSNLPSDLIIKKARNIDNLKPNLNNLETYLMKVDLEDLLLTLDRSITLNDIELASKFIIDFKILDPIIEHYKNNLNNIDKSLWPKHQIDEWINNYISDKSRNKYKINNLDLKTLNYIIWHNILLKIQNKPNSQHLCYYLLDKISNQNIKLKSSKLKKLEHKFNTHIYLWNLSQNNNLTDINIVTMK